MGIEQRRIKEKEELRYSILNTAWKLVKEEGWQSLSIRKIAEAIEYSIPVIYEHFENKEAILSELGKNGFALLAKKVTQARDLWDDPSDQLIAIANAYWNFALSNKEYYRLMYGVGMASCDGGECANKPGTVDNIIMESIRKAIAGSKHPGANPCLKYHTFWSILHGLVSIKIMGTSHIDGELNKLVLQDAVAGFIKNLD